MATNHALRLGKLFGNLQSLEALLRLYLVKIGARGRADAPVSPPYWSLAAGDEVPEDEFTNYDPLGTLIAKFNADIATRDASLAVDTGVVSLRDLLAHGRVSADAEDEARLAILKFDRPKSGKVRVAAAALMDDTWFTIKTEYVMDQILRVNAAHERHAA